MDDAKNWCDLEHDRCVRCRHVDAYIPKGTIRIFTTNHPWALFWPPQCQTGEHLAAIKRRVVWVTLKAPPIKGKLPDGPAAPTVAEAPKSPEAVVDPMGIDEDMLEQPAFPEDDEDVFSFGGGIDE